MKAKEFFVFTKRERSGIISLIILILIVIVIPKCFDGKTPEVENVTALRQADQPDMVKDTVLTKRVTADTFRRVHPPKFARKKLELFEINSADTSAFIALPGIGSKLAARIVLFREKLGGFHNVAQLREVYGLQDSVYQLVSRYLRCDPARIVLIDINKADKEVLSMHPYIRWKTANALMAYREQHGRFTSVDEIRSLENIDAEVVEKMIPYISVK